MARIPKCTLPRERTFVWPRFEVMITQDNCVSCFLALELLVAPRWVPERRRLASSKPIRKVVFLCCFFCSASSCSAIYPIQRLVFVYLERGSIVLGVFWKAVPRYNFPYFLLPCRVPFSKNFSNISYLSYFPFRGEGTLDQE